MLQVIRISDLIVTTGEPAFLLGNKVYLPVTVQALLATLDCQRHFHFLRVRAELPSCISSGAGFSASSLPEVVVV